MQISLKIIVICSILPIIASSHHKKKIEPPVIAQLPNHAIPAPVPVPVQEPVTAQIPNAHTAAPLSVPAPQVVTAHEPEKATAHEIVSAPVHGTKPDATHSPKHTIPVPIPVPVPIPIPSSVVTSQKPENKSNALQQPKQNDTSVVNNVNTTALTYRLPSYVVPYEYDLWLKVDLDNVTFNGHVSIGFTVLKPTKIITLHYKEINVNWKYGRLLDSRAQTMPFINGTDRLEEEMYDLLYKNKLAIGNYNLTLTFHGDIRSDLKGLSRYKYRFEGQDKYLAATYFSRTHARQVFPCFDEPGMKANFSITLLHDDKFQALSNMPQLSRSDPLVQYGNFSQTTFQTTLKMSTYLVAFIVSQDLAVYTEGNGKVKFYATVNQIHRTPHSYTGAIKAIHLLETFLDRKIPLPKTDLISLPQFTSGAMENWGLITFKDPYMFHDYDIFKTPLRDQETSTLMITHELSHNWFGNEVTLEWWTYVWLNEGFARFFEYYISDQIEPTWRLLDEFVITDTRGVMRTDDSALNRAMSTEVLVPDLINSLNDCITYEKAASIIRMMMHMFGLEIFQKSLHDYIVARSYNTSNPTQLFNSFDHRVKNAKLKLPTTVKNIMETWTDNAGYPLITVARDLQNSSITLSQKMFLTNDDIYREIAWTGKYVPITIATSYNANFTDTRPDFWLVPKINSTKRLMPGLNDNTWICINKQESGYYRVKYDRENWKLLTDALNKPDFDKIHNLNRAALIDDAFNLARAGEQDFDIALDMMLYLRNETDYAVWLTARDLLFMLEKYHRGQSSYGQFEKFVQHITANAYSTLRLVTDERDHLTRKKREIVAKLACQHGLRMCIDDAKIVFRDLIDHNKPIVDENRQTVFCTAVKYWYGSVSELNIYLSELFAKDRYDGIKDVLAVLQGLACNQDENSLKSTLALTLNSFGEREYFEPADRDTILEAVIGKSYLGTKIGLEFLRDNYDNITQKYKSIDQILRVAQTNILSESLLNLFKNVTDKHSIKFDANLNNTAKYVILEAGKASTFVEQHHEYFANYWAQSTIKGIGKNAADKNLDINKGLIFLVVAFSIKKLLLF